MSLSAPLSSAPAPIELLCRTLVNKAVKFDKFCKVYRAFLGSEVQVT